MSRIDDLIAKYCPGGVAFKPLGKIGSWRGGGTPSKQRAEFWSGGTIPWLSPKDMNGPKLIKTRDYITEAAVQNSATNVVASQSVALVVRSSILERILPVALVQVPMALNQDMKAVSVGADVVPAYLTHVLRSRGSDILSQCRKSGGSVASIDTRRLMGFEIPLPNVAIQQEISETLDKMETLKFELESELDFELKLRFSQYAFHRDALISGVAESSLRLGEAGVFFGGLVGKSKLDFGGRGSRFVSYTNILRNPSADLRRDDFVRVEQGERQRALNRGDVLFTGSSESRAEVAMASVVTLTPPEPTYLNSFSIGFRFDKPNLIDPEFCKHSFRSGLVREQLIKTANGVTRLNVSKAALARVLVPVPPLAEQRRIAATLDKLYALVNDLSSGLSAEIAARQKQYEHYRDTLLTFDESTTS